MIPQLTETWAGVYAQVIIVLMIFTVGVPTTILQLNESNEYKRLLRNNISCDVILWLIINSTIILVTMEIAFFWYLHPWVHFKLSPGKSLITAIMMTLILIMVIIFWLLLSRFARRESFVMRLTRRLKWRVERGKNVSRSLHDLIALGKVSIPGSEKPFIISSIITLGVAMIRSDNYDGNKLEGVVSGLSQIVRSEFEKGDNKDFRLVGQSFNNLLLDLKSLGFRNFPDYRRVTNRHYELTLEVIQSKSQNLKVMFLQFEFYTSSQWLEIGKTAILTSDFVSASKALNKLEEFVEKNPDDKYFLYDYLALLAFYWYRGVAARIRLLSSFKNIDHKFNHDYRSDLYAAFNDFGNVGMYEEANQLWNFLNDIRGWRVKTKYD